MIPIKMTNLLKVKIKLLLMMKVSPVSPLLPVTIKLVLKLNKMPPLLMMKALMKAITERLSLKIKASMAMQLHKFSMLTEELSEAVMVFKLKL